MFPLAGIAATAAIGVGKAIAGTVAEKLTRTGDDDAVAKARKTAGDFEKMFLENSLEKLNGAEGTEGPLGENGTGGGVWRSMLNQEYAGQIAKSGGVGIASQVFSEILKLQGSGGSAGVAGARS